MVFALDTDQHYYNANTANIIVNITGPTVNSSHVCRFQRSSNGIYTGTVGGAENWEVCNE